MLNCESLVSRDTDVMGDPYITGFLRHHRTQRYLPFKDVKISDDVDNCVTSTISEPSCQERESKSKDRVVS